MTIASLQELVRDAVFKVAPSLVFAGVHGYTVTRDNGDGTIDLAPMPRVLHGPRLRVEQWAAPGMEAGLNVGDKVVIVFASLGADEVMPIIIGHLPLRNGKPASLTIDAKSGSTIAIGTTAATIQIGGVSAVFLAKAQLAANNWSAITAAMTAATVTPGDGGATLKSTFLAGLVGAGYPAWTGTSKVKGV